LSGELTLDENKIQSVIEQSLAKETDYSPEVIHDIAFHMTDWLQDLEEYHQFCTHPDKLTADQINSLLIKFLIHVPNHVAAASKLLTGIPVSDIFEVGATKESDDD
jgi:hypothetical protein